MPDHSRQIVIQNASVSARLVHCGSAEVLVEEMREAS